MKSIILTGDETEKELSEKLSGNRLESIITIGEQVIKVESIVARIEYIKEEKE